MRNKRLGALALAIALCASACSTMRVKTSHDKKADLSKYSTFTVLPSTELKRADVKEFLAGTITAQLEGRGLTPATGAADLWVSYHVYLSGGKASSSSLDYSWDDGWDVYYGTMVPFGSTTARRELGPGMLVVDLVDAGQKKLVWQGTATATLDPQSPTDEVSARVTSALEKMFSGFPRKR